MSYFEQSGSRPRAQGYLTEEQINHFLERLLAWRAELVASTNGIMAELKEVELRKPDVVDCGTLQAEKERSLRTSNRQGIRVAMIDQALQRIEQGSYGYCEMTGEPIGLKRLLAMPLATLCVEAQELLERQRPAGTEQHHLIFSG